MARAMEVEDGDTWTLEHLFYGTRNEDHMPDVDDVRRLLDAYHDEWCMRDATPQSVGPRIFSLLGIDDNHPALTWTYIQGKFKRDFIRWRKLARWCTHYHIDEEGDVNDQLKDIQQVYQIVRNFLIANNTVCTRMRKGVPGTANALPDDANADMDGLTLLDMSAAKLSSWQDSFMRLRTVLSGQNYRRAGKNFLSRCVTPSNLETQAFEPVMEITEFINENTLYVDNLNAWLVHTSCPGTHEQMIKYMTERPLAEAPDIEENCHLRSYEGDAFGRGAVIYDAATDMAWPYVMRPLWPAMEKRVNEIRTLIYRDSKHAVTVPTSEDVCVVHLKTSFPYDTFTEAAEVVQSNPRCLLQCVWYEAEAFECAGKQFHVSHYRIEAYMQRTFVPSTDDEPCVWGRSWQRACGDPTSSMQELQTRSPAAADALTKIARFPLSDEFLRANVMDDITITELHYVKNASDQIWIPLLCMGRKRRYNIDMSTWVALGGAEGRIHRRSFIVLRPYVGQRWAQLAVAPEGSVLLIIPPSIIDVMHANLWEGESCLPEELARTLTISETSYAIVHGTILVPVPVADGAQTRYLRVHTGRNWRDCPTPQFDKIYNSQHFCSHDKFMLWGQKGRTLFTVHEFDTYQTTFIIIGYGGTGKSTIMVVMQKFYPPHLRGILSSNIEQKFGMSQVLQKGRTRAIYCNEVSEDLQLVQEEWQTSCSGEEGSYAVKHEGAWVGMCLAHHFWVGNAWPKHWKNNNNQVSRRLCGVLMDTPIQPRDGNVMEEIDKVLGMVQRKMVLAYFDMVDQYGTIDPMSRPEKLPPAFESFYNTGRALSNPVEKFIEDRVGEDFEFCIGIHPWWGVALIMETSKFRDLYVQWRAGRSDLSRVPSISADKYMPPLREKGVQEQCKVQIRLEDGTLKTTNVLIGIGSCTECPPRRI
jgi:hypothetical protein